MKREKNSKLGQSRKRRKGHEERGKTSYGEVGKEERREGKRGASLREAKGNTRRESNSEEEGKKEGAKEGNYI